MKRRPLTSFHAALALLVPRALSLRGQVFKKPEPEGRTLVRTVVTTKRTEVRQRRQQDEAFISGREQDGD